MSALTDIQQEYLRLFNVMLLEMELKQLRKEMRSLLRQMCADAGVVPAGGLEPRNHMTLDYWRDFSEATRDLS